MDTIISTLKLNTIGYVTMFALGSVAGSIITGELKNAIIKTIKRIKKSKKLISKNFKK